MGSLARVKVTTQGWSGGPGYSQYYYRDETSGIPALGAVNNMLDHVHAAMSELAACEPSIWNATVDPIVDVLEETSGALQAQVTGDAQSLITGAQGSIFGPAAAGVVIGFATADVVNSRVVRGRTFLSPLSPNSEADASPQGSVGSMIYAFRTALAGSGTPVIQHVVWHRPVDSAGGQACDVVGYTSRDRFSVLTSRRG